MYYTATFTLAGSEQYMYTKNLLTCLCASAGKSNETEREGTRCRCDAKSQRNADSNERDDNCSAASRGDENNECADENNEHKYNNCSAAKPWFLYILLWYCIFYLTTNSQLNYEYTLGHFIFP